MVISNRSTPPRTEIVSTTIGHACCMHADIAGCGGHFLSRDAGKMLHHYTVKSLCKTMERNPAKASFFQSEYQILVGI